ncbi:hypothetical protein CFP66_35475 [Pseudonocardia sp. MH-G8]|nr:hypothetical protein CFP66_35475 [Pseudonocardia sp. MH-G8]
MAATAAVAVACGAPAEEPAPEAPHGYVAGAEETAEVQSRLVVADAAGAVRVLDLATEEVVEAGRVDGVGSVTGDGRHAYLASDDGSVRIVDSGSWTVDHGDHTHYYRAAVREVGSVPGADPVAVHADQAVTALALADGTVALLDRARLDEGAVVELATIPRTPHRGPAVPYEGHVLASVAEPGQQFGSGVAVHDRAGAPVATIDEPCPALEGAAVTRRGVVFGCADGALLVSGSDGAFAGEKIPYPQAVTADERVREFRHRPGSALLTARAGEAGIWALDVTARTWTRHDTGPVAAVNSAGAGTALLTLTADGVLHALDPASGAELAATPLLTAPVAPGVRIEVDTSRAYVNDPAAGVIHEIDYADALRVARTFDLGGTPSRMVETGR